MFCHSLVWKFFFLKIVGREYEYVMSSIYLCNKFDNDMSVILSMRKTNQLTNVQCDFVRFIYNFGIDSFFDQFDAV